VPQKGFEMSPLQRQRLIDGELSHIERSDLLASLGNDPGQWKSLALAALEELVWVQQLPKTTSLISDLSANSALDSRSVSDSNLVDQGVRLGENAESTLRPASNEAPLKVRWSQIMAIATAASVLFAVGWFAGRQPMSWNGAQDLGGTFYSSRRPPVNLDANSQFGSSASSPSQNELASSTGLVEQSQSPMRMRMVGANQIPREIPLLDAKDVDPNLVLANEAIEFAKLNQQLKRKGYQLDVQPQYYSGNLDDGRKVIVPVHNVSLKPYGL